MRTSAAPPDVQLISASIDALGDDPAALSGWLARFGAGGPGTVTTLDPPLFPKK